MITFDTKQTEFGYEWRMIKVYESGVKIVLSRSTRNYNTALEARQEHEKIQEELKVQQLKLNL